MTNEEKQLIRQFMADKKTSRLVFGFLKDHMERADLGKDVNALAAKMVAIEQLNLAHDKLNNLCRVDEPRSIVHSQPGL